MIEKIIKEENQKRSNIYFIHSDSKLRSVTKHPGTEPSTSEHSPNRGTLLECITIVTIINKTIIVIVIIIIKI